MYREFGSNGEFEIRVSRECRLHVKVNPSHTLNFFEILVYREAYARGIQSNYHVDIVSCKTCILLSMILYGYTIHHPQNSVC